MLATDRLYQACHANDQDNAEVWSKNFKQGNNCNSSRPTAYHDSSMFTASLRRVRMKANLQRLKEKEMRVVQERREMQKKQIVVRQI